MDDNTTRGAYETFGPIHAEEAARIPLPEGARRPDSRSIEALKANDSILLQMQMVESVWVTCRVLEVADGQVQIIARDLLMPDGSPIVSHVPVEYVSGIVRDN